MDNKKYRIKYEIHLQGGEVLKDKEIKIDKCMSDIHAQVRLEDYLKRKYINFERLVVTAPIVEVTLNNIFSQFGDIFGEGFNPFGGNFGKK